VGVQAAAQEAPMNDLTQRLKGRLEAEVLSHRIIASNPYTAWFKQGEFTWPQARAFLVQFSVFSNQFLIAQLHKMINADTLEEMRASKEILANEIGVGFRGGSRSEDPQLGGIEGSVEGSTFHFRAAHFELLTRMARHFDLSFSDLGKRRLGTEATLFFCDELVRLYGHEDYTIATAASWAIENWAAAGFWDELVEGWERFAKREGLRKLDMAFFSWHARLEANHAHHTWEEVETFCGRPELDQDAFIRYANEMLDGVYAFWRGLDEQRRAIAAEQRHAQLG